MRRHSSIGNSYMRYILNIDGWSYWGCRALPFVPQHRTAMTSPSDHRATTDQPRLLDARLFIQLLPVHSARSPTMSTSVHFQGPALQKPAGLVGTKVLLRSGHSCKYHAQGLSWFFIPACSLVFLLKERNVWSGSSGDGESCFCLLGGEPGVLNTPLRCLNSCPEPTTAGR